MAIYWISNNSAHIDRDTQGGHKPNDTGPEGLSWHQIENDSDSHMAIAESTVVVITYTDRQYYVSMVCQDRARQVNANTTICHVDSLEAALIKATTWAQVRMAEFNAGV